MIEAKTTAGRTQLATDQGAPDHSLNRSYVDWAAILGGVVVAAAIGSVFTAFGAALGLSAVSAEPGEGSGTLALVLTGLWMVVTLVASYLAGGYVAGRMRRRVDTATADEVTARDGMNGLIVWGAGIIFTALLISNAVSATVSAAGSAVETVATTAGSALGGLAEGAASLVPEDPISSVTDALIRPTQIDPATADREELTRQAASILGSVVTTGELSDADRTYLVNAASTLTGLPPAEVNARVDQAVQAATQAREDAAAALEEAEAAARDAAETARISAVLTAFILTAASLIAAAAAVIGAVKGGQHRDEGQMFGGFSYRA